MLSSLILLLFPGDRVDRLFETLIVPLQVSFDFFKLFAAWAVHEA